MNKSKTKAVRLSRDDWAEVGDLIDQCIQVADMDTSYARHIRDKAMAMMKQILNKAVCYAIRPNTRNQCQLPREVINE